MNCTKPDQLAVVNWPGSSVHNHIVTTQEFVPQGQMLKFCGKTRCAMNGPAWWVQSPSPVESIYGPVQRFPVYDHHLRRIDGPENGGVEQSNFQRPIPSAMERLKAQIAAINEARKYSRSQS